MSALPPTTDIKRQKADIGWSQDLAKTRLLF